jgi:hypothetical protein
MVAITTAQQDEDGEYLNPYSIFKYAMNSPVTRDRYTTRLDRFFSFVGIEGTDIDERCRVFVQNARKDNSWAFRSIINFLQVQKERVDKKEITGSTVRNYVKAIKLFTENQPIAEDVGRLKKEIKICEMQSRKDETKIEQVEELKEELEKLLRESKYQIDLHGRILVFLEPPHPEVWNILKPIISHDHWEMEHPYVDTDLKTKNVVTRGWPVCIFCSARDESKWDIWPEIQSRFIMISPNMSKQKYAVANVLTFEKLGLPDFVQDQIIVSNKEIEMAQKCILLLRERIRRLCRLPHNFEEFNYKPTNPVWIPYYEYLAKSLPATRGIDMRNAKHVGSLLAVIAIAKSMFLLDIGGEGKLSAIARSEDLIETLRIAQNLVSGEYSGIPVHKIKFFEELFRGVYNIKEGPDEKDGKIEPLKGVTTRELSDYYKKVKGKGTSPDNLKKQFLEELKANDLIVEVKSEIDGRRLLFYPLMPSIPREAHEKITKLSNEDIFDNISYIPILELSRDYKYIPENWLIRQILALAKYRINFELAIDPFADYLNQSEDLKFLEADTTLGAGSSTRLTIRDFISKYESSLSIRYIFKADFYGFYNDKIGFMIEVCLLDYILYKKMSNHNAFDNFDISNSHTIPDDPLTKIECPPKCYHCNAKDFMTREMW